MSDRSDHVVPTCPRCGYDQSGAVAAWGEACPVRGVCSECGAEFDWSRAFRHAVPPFWSYEHGAWYDARRAVWTLGWMVWPWGFWTCLEPGARVRVGRVLLLLFIVLAAGAGCLLAFEAFRDAPRGVYRRGILIPRGIALQGVAVLFTASGAIAAVLLTSLVAGVLAIPAAAVHSGASRLLRAWLYSVIGIQVAWCGAAVALATALQFPGPQVQRAFFFVLLGLTLGLLGWLAMWWTCAVHMYLHIANPYKWTNRAGLTGVVGTILLVRAAWRAGLWPL